MSDVLSIPVNYFRAEKGLSDHPGPAHTLSVLVGESAISVAILDTARSRFVGIGDFRNPPAKEDKEKPAMIGLQVLYKKLLKEFPGIQKIPVSHLGLEGGKSTLVPAGMFSAGDEEHFLSFNIHAEENDFTGNDLLEVPAGRNIYAISRNIRDFATSTFNPQQIHHFTTSVLRGVLSHPISKSREKRLFVNFRDHFVDLVITENGSLVFCNSFACREPEDIVYYVIFVLEQFGIGPGSSDILLMGRVSREEKVVSLLERYTHHPDFIEPGAMYHFSPVFDNIPKHRYFSLLNLPLCAS